MPIENMQVSVSFDVNAKVEKLATSEYICWEVEGLTWKALKDKLRKEQPRRGREQLRHEDELYPEGLVTGSSPKESVERFVKLSMPWVQY